MEEIPKKIVKKHVYGFVDFIRQRGVVGVALGLVLGGVVTKVVTALMGDIINPILGIVLGKATSLQYLSIKVAGVRISYGHFISVLIDAFVVLLVVYFAIKILRIEYLDKKK